MFNNALFNRNNNNKKLIYRSLINLKKHFNIIFEINSKISTSDIIKCIIYLMQMVEEYNINGINKKEIVLYTMKNIILEYKNNIHAYEYIENFINTILPSLIDTIISLDKKDKYIKIENVIKPSCWCM